TADIDPYIKVNKEHLIALREAINNIRKAYSKKIVTYDEDLTFIKLTHYNEIVKHIIDVNDFINSFDSNYTFDINLELKNNSKYITDKEWDGLIEALILI
ncbi:MAG: hypothetical protein ACRDB0_02270, partial [Paraclostridium sp.]